jgi:hypothetical protein
LLMPAVAIWVAELCSPKARRLLAGSGMAGYRGPLPEADIRTGILHHVSRWFCCSPRAVQKS